MIRKPGESVLTYPAELRSLAKRCMQLQGVSRGSAKGPNNYAKVLDVAHEVAAQNTNTNTKELAIGTSKAKEPGNT